MARLGQRLAQLSSESIDLARVRANGFAFLLARDAGQRSAVRLAERALAAVRAIEWDSAEVDPSATAGIALAPVGQDYDVRVLMRQAEEAAERARAGEKFSFQVFDPEHHDAVVAGEFIGVVESSGLMLPVGRWVLGQACRDAVHWPLLPNGSAATVRVNVSTRQFDESSLVEDVAAALAESGLVASRLCLEITETTLMRDIDHALDVLQQLKQVGVSVAIDDFGTGYASLVYLKRLPVDVLKIDRSFVEGMPGAMADTAIVRAVVGLAASLGMDVIAEGVEHLVQEEALQALGVRRMQGWLYGKAMDQASLCELLSAIASRR